MKRIYSLTIMLGLLINTPVVAESMTLKPQTQGDISFVSGGVGGEERSQMNAMRADYNLQLLFIQKGSGEYLSNIKVRIEDVKGNILLESVVDGPLLFLKLQPGNYNVNANQNGYDINTKAVITIKKTKSLTFSWPKQ